MHVTQVPTNKLVSVAAEINTNYSFLGDQDRNVEDLSCIHFIYKEMIKYVISREEVRVTEAIK